MPDENDIVYDTYGIDLIGILRALLEALFGGGSESIIAAIAWFWDFFSIIALLLALFFTIGFVYAKIRFNQLYEEELELVKQEEQLWAQRYRSAGAKNDRWEDIQAHINSDNPNEWRLAIIEADVMLDQTLRNAGYVGDSIGEMLKGASHSSFQTLEDAWEAHKVRNTIAHEGSDFVLTRKVAQETLTRFERVFREFGVV